MFVVVLVVDDESLVREIVAEDLCDDGLEVIQASTAEDALSLAEQSKAPDAVVTDVHLGQGMDGIRFAAEIHRRWPETGVVIMTGQPSRLSTSERACTEHLLVKPFAPSALVRAVRNVMRRDEG
jgi:DNA-binding response OmpR family regulator